MGMHNVFSSVFRLALCAAACCAYAADFKVSAWRGETLSVLVPDYTELGESPAGLDVRCGVLRTVRYRPVPSELQVAECYDIVDWSTASGGTQGKGTYHHILHAGEPNNEPWRADGAILLAWSVS